MSIKSALQELLDRLVEIQSKHSGLRDTAVREVLREHIYWGIRKPVEVYEFDKDFNMFSKIANTSVHNALYQFLNDPAIVAIRSEQKSDDKILAACRELDIEIDREHDDLLILLGLFWH